MQSMSFFGATVKATLIPTYDYLLLMLKNTIIFQKDWNWEGTETSQKPLAPTYAHHSPEWSI